MGSINACGRPPSSIQIFEPIESRSGWRIGSVGFGAPHESVRGLRWHQVAIVELVHLQGNRGSSAANGAETQSRFHSGTSSTFLRLRTLHERHAPKSPRLVIRFTLTSYISNPDVTTPSYSFTLQITPVVTLCQSATARMTPVDWRRMGLVRLSTPLCEPMLAL